MFVLLEDERIKEVERRTFDFQFLATIVAQIAGNKDANFMEINVLKKPRTDEQEMMLAKQTEAYLDALVARGNRGKKP